MAATWECESCGWNCPPDPAITVEEAGCGSCGCAMFVPNEQSDAWDRFEATVEAIRQSGGYDLN